MAISQVKAIINGVETILSYNSSTGKYQATIQAPSLSSCNQSGHFYGVKIQVQDDSGVDLSTVSLQIDNDAAITAGFVQTAITGGYKFAHNIVTALSDGNHTIKINAKDNDANAATEAQASFSVDTSSTYLLSAMSKQTGIHVVS